MACWLRKRLMWAALAGATFASSTSIGRGEDPPKVGSTITLPIEGKGDCQFKVIKTEKQPDGSYFSELKDVKSGDTITLQTRPGNEAPTPPSTPSGDSKLPKAKPRTSDPLTPPISAIQEPTKEKDRHPFLHRLFGDSDKDRTPGAMPKTDSSADTGKKPGPLARLFGAKKPTTPSMPAATAGPVVKPSQPTPPPILPVPPGGLAANPAPAPALFPTPSTTNEPPRVMPARPQPPVQSQAVPSAPAFPVAPQTPAVPQPMPPSASTPPAPLPTVPTPVPALPSALPLPPLPAPVLPGAPIPVPPGGTSAARPIQIVVPAGYVPPGVAFDREVQPYVIALQTMTAPSARLSAAKALADGRHASTDGVKSVLFRAAQSDPCGEVRAACIGHLSMLGYFSPSFLGYIQSACEDTDPMVRDAAKAACAKMLRK